MSVWYPSFYPDFRCRAGACRHSCCKGWEIDVDGDSAAFYRTLDGALGNELRQALFENEEGWHFRLTGEERCPFLRPDGLCRLICELGEDALCDICALHPRFFQELGEDELWGLGLSCEEVSSLLLKQELRFVCRETGERLDFASLLEHLGLSLPPALLRYRLRIDENRRRELLERFRLTEPIDGRWPEQLRALESAPLPQPAAEERYQRVYEYIFFRQLERLDEVGAARIGAYARLSTDLIALWNMRSPALAEILRRWSEQIEYSTENVDRLLDS